MSAAPSLDVTVNTGDFPEADADALERAVRAAVATQDVEHAEISLTLLGDEAIQGLNLRYLAEDRPTDVLAFTLGTEPAVLGDVYLGVDQARRQAAELGLPLEEELVRLAVHGTLHVLGHDHPEGEDRDASPMFVLQEELVRRLLG